MTNLYDIAREEDVVTESEVDELEEVGQDQTQSFAAPHLRQRLLPQIVIFRGDVGAQGREIPAVVPYIRGVIKLKSKSAH